MGDNNDGVVQIFPEKGKTPPTPARITWRQRGGLQHVVHYEGCQAENAVKFLKHEKTVKLTGVDKKGTEYIARATYKGDAENVGVIELSALNDRNTVSRIPLKGCIEIKKLDGEMLKMKRANQLVSPFEYAKTDLNILYYRKDGTTLKQKDFWYVADDRGEIQYSDIYGEQGAKQDPKEQFAVISFIGNDKKRYRIITGYDYDAERAGMFLLFRDNKLEKEFDLPVSLTNDNRDFNAMAEKWLDEKKLTPPVIGFAKQGEEILEGVRKFSEEVQKKAYKERFKAEGAYKDAKSNSFYCYSKNYACIPIVDVNGGEKGRIYCLWPSESGEKVAASIVLNDKPDRVFYTEEFPFTDEKYRNGVKKDETDRLCCLGTALQVFKPTGDGTYPSKVIKRETDGTQSAEHYNADGTISQYEKSVKFIVNGQEFAAQAFRRWDDNKISSFGLVQLNTKPQQTWTVPASGAESLKDCTAEQLKKKGAQMLQAVQPEMAKYSVVPPVYQQVGGYGSCLRACRY